MFQSRSIRWFPVFALVLTALQGAVGRVSAQQVVGWRGDGTGVYTDVNPPTRWSKTMNVVWATKMGSRSNAQPVIAGDRVFLCAEPFTLVCLNRADGKVVWQRTNSYRDITSDEDWVKILKELNAAAVLRSQLDTIKAEVAQIDKALEKASNKKELEARLEALGQQSDDLEKRLELLPLAARYTLPKTQTQYNGYTTATPTTDGKRVWAVFGNRVVVCYDLKGNRQWSAVLPDDPQSVWGHSSSPLLIGDKLIVNIEHIVAFNAKSGKQLWRTKYGQTWGSAVRANIGDEDAILLSNGRIVRAADGKVMVRVPSLDRASPFVSDGKAYYIDIRANAYKIPAKAADKIELKELWSADPKGGEFYASSVLHNGLVYTVSTRHILNVIDASTGKILYVKRLSLGNGPVWPSLCAAGNYVYISSRDGTTLVLRAGRKYDEVARNKLEFFISTPVFHGNRMYVRTNEHLFCIGES